MSGAGRLSLLPFSTQPPSPLAFVLVGRVADNNGDALLPLDPIRLAARFAQRHEDLRDVFLLDERVAQGVGDEQAHRVGPARKRLARKFLQLGQQAKLGHREGSKLYLEPDQPWNGGFDHPRNRSRPLIRFRRFGDAPQHTQEIGAGAGGRVRHGHVGEAKPSVRPK